MKDRFARGNRKLSKDILIWNLPRVQTCPGAGDCLTWCYETKFERMYKGVLPFRRMNLELTYHPDFVDKVVVFLSKAKEPFIRVHECGDFYDQDYLDAWYRIARSVPKKNFYAYTKSLHLDLWTHKPRNFNILQSSGGIYDDKTNWRRPTFRAIRITQPLRKQEMSCPYGYAVDQCGSGCTVCIRDPHAHVTILIHR